jgi:hypothetical protein
MKFLLPWRFSVQRFIEDFGFYWPQGGNSLMFPFHFALPATSCAPLSSYFTLTATLPKSQARPLAAKRIPHHTSPLPQPIFLSDGTHPWNQSTEWTRLALAAFFLEVLGGTERVNAREPALISFLHLTYIASTLIVPSIQWRSQDFQIGYV